MVKCCKNCEKRHKNCHSDCEQYKKESEETTKENRWLQKEKERDYINSYEFDKVDEKLFSRKSKSK